MRGGGSSYTCPFDDLSFQNLLNCLHFINSHVYVLVSGNIHWVGLDGSPEPSSETLRALGMKGYDKPQGMYNWELVQSGMLDTQISNFN